MDRSLISVNAFSIASISRLSLRIAEARSKATLHYGRNMEIWPPVGANDAIHIQDSFPNGVLAPSFTSNGDPASPKQRLDAFSRIRSLWHQIVCAPLSPLHDGASKSSICFLWLTVGIWIMTLRTGAIRRIDLFTISALTGYFVIWQQQWTRSTPTLSLNKGLIPYTVQFPLGYHLTRSRRLRIWKRMGHVIDQIIPFSVLLLAWTTETSAGAKFLRHSFYSWMTRVLFLSSSQAIVEHLSDRTRMGVRSVALPIRSFIQGAFSSVRLLYLWQWICTLHQLDAFPFNQGTSAFFFVGTCLRALPLVHMLYWIAHLLGFLLPVSMVRYLRVYFYMVEAQEVQLRTTANTVL